MALKKFKPITPALRTKTVADFSVLTTDTPEKSLTVGKKRISGRNNAGRITMRRRGGGHKKRIRIIDYKRNKIGIEGIIKTVEYDPNRSAFISLVEYTDGEKRYILAPLGIEVGQKIVSGENVRPDLGNALPLKNIPIAMDIHNLEMNKGKGGQLVRSGGSAAQIMGKEGEYCIVKLPSGEVRMILNTCKATIGVVGNLEHENISLGKAGRSRWLGRRPKVRGVAMNPIDHPNGGGEGKSKGGRHPVSPWGQPTKGYKTRRNKRTQSFIVKRRA